MRRSRAVLGLSVAVSGWSTAQPGVRRSGERASESGLSRHFLTPSARRLWPQPDTPALSVLCCPNSETTPRSSVTPALWGAAPRPALAAVRLGGQSWRAAPFCPAPCRQAGRCGSASRPSRYAVPSAALTLPLRSKYPGSRLERARRRFLGLPRGGVGVKGETAVGGA